MYMSFHYIVSPLKKIYLKLIKMYALQCAFQRGWPNSDPTITLSLCPCSYRKINVVISLIWGLVTLFYTVSWKNDMIMFKNYIINLSLVKHDEYQPRIGTFIFYPVYQWNYKLEPVILSQIFNFIEFFIDLTSTVFTVHNQTHLVTVIVVLQHCESNMTLLVWTFINILHIQGKTLWLKYPIHVLQFFQEERKVYRYFTLQILLEY